MKRLIVILIILLCCYFNTWANTPIMPLSDVKPGMKGILKTVLKGTDIESFDIEVIDIIKNFLPQFDIILIRLLSSQLKQTGVISGMSGSPIYVEDKLVGAFAYAFSIFQKEPIAGVTPIEYMLQIEKKEELREKETAAVRSFNRELLAQVLSNEPESDFDLLEKLNHAINRWSDNPYQLKPISLPLSCSGFGAELIHKLSPSFEQFGFLVFPGGSNSYTPIPQDAIFKPGDAVSGVIITGDYTIAATGTVTFCDGNKILAFGHPFFNSGPVNFPMAKAQISTVLSNFILSYKIGSPGEVIGNIRQDRISGVLGIVGEQAPMFPVEIEYHSPFDQTKHYHYMVAKDPSLSFLSPILLYATFLNTLESARFSSGDYSLKLDGKLSIKEHPDVIFNNFYTSRNFSDPAGSGQDIMVSAYDITVTLLALLNNDYYYPQIDRLKLSFHAIPGKRSMKIDKVWHNKSEVNEGEQLNLTILLRAYQGDSRTIHQTIAIPTTISSNRLIVSVGSANYMTALERNSASSKFQPKNFNELIQLINDGRKNNVLYIQLKVVESGAIISGQELPQLPPTILTILSEKKTRGSASPLQESVLREFKIPIDYEVFGGKSFAIKFKK